MRSSAPSLGGKGGGVGGGGGGGGGGGRAHTRFKSTKVLTARHASPSLQKMKIFERFLENFRIHPCNRIYSQ